MLCGHLNGEETLKRVKIPTDRWVDIDMVHIYNGILLSHKEEQIWVSCSEVDELGACYSEWSKKEINIIY